MSSQFPTTIDSFVNPTATQRLAEVPHDEQHSHANDAIAALENKVGIDGSQVSNSLDYLVKAALDPGHAHTQQLPLAHTHVANDVTSGTFALTLIPSTLTGKDADSVDGKHASDFYTQVQLQTSGQSSVNWGNITNAPSSFTPAAHTHVAADVASGTLALDRIPATLTGKDADTLDTYHAVSFGKLSETNNWTADNAYSAKLSFGAAKNAAIYHDGTNLVVNPRDNSSTGKLLVQLPVRAGGTIDGTAQGESVPFLVNPTFRGLTGETTTYSALSCFPTYMGLGDANTPTNASARYMFGAYFNCINRHGFTGSNTGYRSTVGLGMYNWNQATHNSSGTLTDEMIGAHITAEATYDYYKLRTTGPTNIKMTAGLFEVNYKPGVIAVPDGVAYSVDLTAGYFRLRVDESVIENMLDYRASKFAPVVSDINIDMPVMGFFSDTLAPIANYYTRTYIDWLGYDDPMVNDWKVYAYYAAKPEPVTLQIQGPQYYSFYSEFGDWWAGENNQKFFFGKNRDASICFDGSNLVINPRESSQLPMIQTAAPIRINPKIDGTAPWAYGLYVAPDIYGLPGGTYGMNYGLYTCPTFYGPGTQTQSDSRSCYMYGAYFNVANYHGYSGTAAGTRTMCGASFLTYNRAVHTSAGNYTDIVNGVYASGTNMPAYRNTGSLTAEINGGVFEVYFQPDAVSVPDDQTYVRNLTAGKFNITVDESFCDWVTFPNVTSSEGYLGVKSTIDFRHTIFDGYCGNTPLIANYYARTEIPWDDSDPMYMHQKVFAYYAAKPSIDSPPVGGACPRYYSFYSEFGDWWAGSTGQAFIFGPNQEVAMYYNGSSLLVDVDRCSGGVEVVGSVKALDGFYSGVGKRGISANVETAKPGGGTRTLHFSDGLYTGYTDT